MDARNVISKEEQGALVARMEDAGFYGILETHFEAGRIVRLRRQETILKKDMARVLKK